MLSITFSARWVCPGGWQFADRPVYHHLRDSIEAHLTIVFGPDDQPLDRAPNRMSSCKFVKTARRRRTIEIPAGKHFITAVYPMPADFQTALSQIHGPAATH